MPPFSHPCASATTPATRLFARVWQRPLGCRRHVTRRRRPTNNDLHTVNGPHALAPPRTSLLPPLLRYAASRHTQPHRRPRPYNPAAQNGVVSHAYEGCRTYTAKPRGFLLGRYLTLVVLLPPMPLTDGAFKVARHGPSGAFPYISAPFFFPHPSLRFPLVPSDPRSAEIAGSPRTPLHGFRDNIGNHA